MGRDFHKMYIKLLLTAVENIDINHTGNSNYLLVNKK